MKERKFGLKIFIYNLIMISLIVGSLFSAFIWYYIKDEGEKVENELLEIMKRGMGNVEDSIDMLDTIALQLSTNPNVIQTMKNIDDNRLNNYFQEYPTEEAKIYELLWSYILNPENVSRVSIYNEYGDYIYAGEATNANKFVYRSSEMMGNIMKQFQNPNVNSIFINELDKSMGIKRHGVSVIREIKDSYLKDNEGLGYVEVKLNIKDLEEKILMKSQKQVMVLYDLKTKKVIGTSVEGYIENTRWTYEQLITQLHLSDSYQYMDELEEYNLGFLVLEERSEQRVFVRNTLLLGFIIYICLIWGFAMIQKRMVTDLTRPLIRLCHTVQYTDSKQAREEAIEKSNIYEIQILSDAFQDMINSLEESMKREVEIHTSQIKTQLYALQAQMNPHFIHNTIAILQSYAIEEDYDTIISTCGTLSDLIRYSARLSQNKVNMIDEINHIQNYMALVKLRYEDNIQYSITLPSEMEQVEVPSFIVQPVIENSLNHGLKSKPFPWQLSIECMQLHGKWIIEIRDNGRGMSEENREKLQQYRSNIEVQNSNKLVEMQEWNIGGLSLKNIIVRLYLEYGTEMIFEIESQEQAYTVVRIGGPQ